MRWRVIAFAAPKAAGPALAYAGRPDCCIVGFDIGGNVASESAKAARYGHSTVLPSPTFATDPTGGVPEGYGGIIRREAARWARVIAETGSQME